MRRLPSLRLGAVLALLCTLPVTGQTLEAILSAPFPSEILASPSGGRFAWVQNDRGIRNVWVAEPPDYRGRQVTRYDKDDGQFVGSLEWTPDGRTLFYVRGGAANRQGEIPNPTSDPAGAEQAIWRVSIEGGEPVRVGPGSNPAPSPRGDGLAFTRKGQVFWAPLDGSKEPAALIQTRGGSGSLRWSPDGSRLAFVSNRGNHNFVGVYDMAARTVRWMAPGVDEDMRPAWSPDGTRVAFIRAPARKVFPLFRPNRETQPWSILVADVATGRATTVWRAREGRGSAFREIEAANDLFWGAGDRIAFPWEGDGWLHLYSVPVSGTPGGEATLLTPGQFEVENVILSPDRRELIFSSNQGDIDRRHLWRVPVAGGPPVAVTRGEGIEWMPALTHDGSGGSALAYIQAEARSPARAVVQIGSQPARDLAPGTIPADYPDDQLVEPEQVIYSSADGMRIHAQLFRPRNLKSGERRPALIFLHGGSHRQMLLGWHHSPYYNKAYGMNQYLASRGYVVLAINFRAGIGYGLDFREAQNIGAAGASEFNDVLGAGLYLRSRPDVDPDRIGLWGGSYGGYLTALGLAKASHLFAAGVDIHGVHDWNVGIRNFIPDYDPTPDERRLAFESSPMAWLDSWRSPVLLIHGDDDRNVGFAETVELAEELRERKVDVEILVFPDEVHSFLLHSSWLEAFRAAADFFDRKLGNRAR